MSKFFIFEGQRWGIVAVLLSATSFAFSSVLYKIAYSQGFTPPHALAMHTWIGGILLLIYALLFERQILRPSLRILLLTASIGLIGKLGTNFLFAYSLQHLTASLTILLFYLYIIFVLIGGRFFLKKKLRVREVISSIIVLSGAALASGAFQGFANVSRLGILFIVGAALCYTVYNIVGERTLMSISPFAVMCYTQWFSSLGILLYLGGDIVALPWDNVTFWGIGLTMAFATSILPFYLILFGIGRIGSSQASILSTFEIPLTYVLSAFLLYELPVWNQLAGGVLVLSGIIYLYWRK